MKMRSLFLAVVLVVMCAMPANAVSSRAIGGGVTLDFDGTTAVCYATITANNRDTISATMSLWDGNDCVATWRGTATGYLVFDKTADVSKGESYTLTVDVTINGKVQPQMSTSGTCK